MPFDPVEMRIGWLQTPTTPVNAATFAPPATVGTTTQTLIPDFPQAFLDLSLRRANLAIWAATDLDLVAVTGNYITTAAGTALTVDGVSGSYWITTSLIGLYDGGNPVTLVFPGLVIATQEWVNAQSFSGGGITYTSLASGTLSGANFTFSTPAPIVAAWDAAETKAFVIAFGNSATSGTIDRRVARIPKLQNINTERQSGSDTFRLRQS